MIDARRALDYSRSTKRIVFVGSALEDLRRFPETGRRRAGFQLDRVQRGLDPDDWKPMSSVGTGVREIRVRDGTEAYRVIYVANLADAVYVLHAFQKKTQRTSKPDLELALARLRDIIGR